MKKTFVSAFSALLLSFSVSATDKSQEAPLLVIGASYANASTPFFSDLQAPLGGTSVNLGTYLSLGNALVRDLRLSGHVINEAQAGATSFDRLACFPGPDCIGPGWEGLNKQLTKALARVTGPEGPTAKYIVIAKGNDCMHPDAFGIPMVETSECTLEQMNESIDYFIAAGQRALALGITPIYNEKVPYENLDLETFRVALGWDWIVGEASYNEYEDLRLSRIKQELPQAIIVDAWKGFDHLGDGLHPDRKTTVKAAKRIAKAIKRHQRAQ